MNKRFLCNIFINIALLLSCPFLILYKRIINSSEFNYFYSPTGVLGNNKYVYDFFILKNEPCEIIRTNISTWELYKLGAKFVVGGNLFLTHGIGGLPVTIFFLKRIQLWHGLPLKKILLDANIDTVKFNNKLLNYIYLGVLKLRINISYDYLITSNSILGNCLKTAFGFNSKKVFFFGTPSLEFFDKNNSLNINEEFVDVLYMPTWRDGGDKIIDLILNLKNYLDDEFLNKNKIRFFLKLHPFEMNLIKDIQCESSFFILVQDKIDDMSLFYTKFDCLITDYSSACFEFYPINKNMFFYTPDLDEYTRTRGFYIDFNRFLSENINCNTPEELRNCLQQWLNCEKDIQCDLSSYIGNNEDCVLNIYKKFSVNKKMKKQNEK